MVAALLFWQMTNLLHFWNYTRRLIASLNSDEVLANHHRKSPQRWMELRLYRKYGSQRPTNFGLWPQRVKTRDAFIFRADGVLTAFIELEATISTHSLGRTYE